MHALNCTYNSSKAICVHRMLVSKDMESTLHPYCGLIKPLLLSDCLVLALELNNEKIFSEIQQ